MAECPLDCRGQIVLGHCHSKFAIGQWIAYAADCQAKSRRTACHRLEECNPESLTG
jgi:hypothetical protein